MRIVQIKGKGKISYVGGVRQRGKYHNILTQG